MRRSLLRLYGPLMAVILAQALFIASAPSKPAGSPQIANQVGGQAGGQAAGAAGQAGGQAAGAAGQAGSQSAGGATGQAGGPQTSAGNPGGTSASAPGTGDNTGGSSGAAGSTTGNTGASGAAGGADTGDQQGGGTDDAQTSAQGTRTASSSYQGDTSHCTEDGYQTDLIYYAPLCKPKWPQGRDNGGATYRGVTGDTIKVMFFREDKSEAVNAILQPQGLRASTEEQRSFMQAAEEFLNKHYEFYGRKLDLVLFEASNCPETPPDVAACKAEARRAAKEDPFAIVWPVPVYPTVFDEWVKEGIISLGGWNFSRSYFAARRPYRWDVLMDGTQTAEIAAEYYCKQMANKPASRAGRIIHPSFPNGGDRNQVQRKLGIIVPDQDARLRAARILQQRVAECDDKDPILIRYSQNVETGQQQAGGNTARLIDEQVTTVICTCDPIAPFFRTRDNQRNNYHPEYLLSGGGLIDYDKIGRLYEQEEWMHAFGPSHLARPLPQSEAAATTVWQDTGHSGNACVPCNLPWSYYQMLAIGLQEAGPNLNPLTFEQGLFDYPDRGGWAESGRDPTKLLARFGENDYTLTSDTRIVYWDRNQPSRVDGQPGSYVGLNSGRRYQQGSLPTSFGIPQKSR